MAVNLMGDHAEVFKFRSTVEYSDYGLMELFEEVRQFRIDEKRFGRNWKPVDFRSDDTTFYVRLEEV